MSDASDTGVSDTGVSDTGVSDTGVSDASDADGGHSDTVCSTDSDCRDVLFCDGVERCRPADPLADAAGCVAMGDGCTAYIKASNTDSGDSFDTVALSADGSTLAVGAWHESSNATGINGDEADNSAESAGAVYIFTRSGTTWSQQAYIKASNTDAGDRFGNSLALSADGSTLAVGAHREASNATGAHGDEADNSALNAGAVYIFTRSDSTWSQQAYIKASNTDAEDHFGNSVALSGDGSTLAVGAGGEDSSATDVAGEEADDSADGAGAVYVFTRTAASWSQQAYVKASNTDAEDRFGVAVRLSADASTLAVGAYGEGSRARGVDGAQADNGAPFSGAVYIFTRTAASWSQQAYIKASNTDRPDDFGAFLALSGDGSTLAVTAFHEASSATGIDGDQADNSWWTAGAVYVFARMAETWSQQAYVKASNTNIGDSFGWSVALSADGSSLAVGADNECSSATGVGGDQADDSSRQAGAVYVFTRVDGTWSQHAYVKASNSGEEDSFGTDLAMSADGSVLAISAGGEDSSATGVGGDQGDNSARDSGAVYVF